MLSAGPDRMDVTECDCGTCPGCEYAKDQTCNAENPCGRCEDCDEASKEDLP